jgi:uncharacterized protein (TIGR02646 family)
MKNVFKSPEPEELKKYKKRYASQFKRWKDDLQGNRKAYNSVRETLAIDQRGLCAYCEIDLHPSVRCVDHFIPRHQSTRENNYDLDWQNMLANCKGGMENIDISEEEIERRISQPPNRVACCSAAKDGFIPDGKLLNPLELPTLRLFRFSSLDGEIRPDENACENAAISVEYVQFTIQKLGLNVQRLKNERVAIISEITEELDKRDDGIINPILLKKQIASERFGDGKDDWPAFFTTIRWVLGKGAEDHLLDISYSG